MNEVSNPSVWVRCRTCARETDHAVCGQYSRTAIPEQDQHVAENGERLLFAWTTSQILECCRCGRPCFRQGWTSTPQLEGTWAWRIYADPEDRAPLLAVRCLPAKVGKLYRETWQAFQCGAFTLATVGMRAVIEAVCSERHCKGVDLQQKIRKLNGVLSAGDINLLQTHRALGNAAVHQMETPSSVELAAALDVLEHLLKTLYELPRRAADFKRLRMERLNGNSLQLREASTQD
jgi:hypothetical protein